MMIRLTSRSIELYPHVLKEIDISSYIEGTKNHYVKIISARDADYFPVNDSVVVSEIENGVFSMYTSVLCDVKWELYGENDLESIMRWHPMI